MTTKQPSGDPLALGTPEHHPRSAAGTTGSPRAPALCATRGRAPYARAPASYRSLSPAPRPGSARVPSRWRPQRSGCAASAARTTFCCSSPSSTSCRVVVSERPGSSRGRDEWQADPERCGRVRAAPAGGGRRRSADLGVSFFSFLRRRAVRFHKQFLAWCGPCVLTSKTKVSYPRITYFSNCRILRFRIFAAAGSVNKGSGPNTYFHSSSQGSRY